MTEGGITREWLDELRSRNDIVTTISRYVPLKQKGRSYWGCCPFHAEKTPSFSVDPARQFYHCFGCGEGGDVFKFISKVENIGFIDAVKILAEAAHMEVPSGTVSHTDDGAKQKRDDMYEINRIAALRYHHNLDTPAGAAARDYLERRGVSPSMIKKFGLGVSVDYNDLVSVMRDNNCNLDLAVEGGLLGRREDSGRYYDVFGTRLMFPILDSFGHVVAFGGRILEKSDTKAKYKNTSGTFLFDKSKNIYGINLIKKLRLKKNFDTLILCEGYVDVISLHQAGFDTAVASMGTALTREQCRILSRFAKKVIISYDGDSAGQKATLRGLEMLKEEGLEVLVLSLPDGLDPDDLIKKRGADAYQKCIDTAVPYFDFKLSTLARQQNMKTLDGRTKFATLAVEEIKLLNNTIEQERYLKLAQTMSGFSMESLQRQMESDMTDDGVKTAVQSKPLMSAVEKAAQFVLYSMVNRYPFAQSPPDLSGILSGEAEEIYRAFSENKKLTLVTAFQTISDTLHTALTEIADGDQGVAEEQRESYYRGCANTIIRASYERELEELSRAYDSDVMNAERNKILQSIIKIQTKLNELL